MTVVDTPITLKDFEGSYRVDRGVSPYETAVAWCNKAGRDHADICVPRSLDWDEINYDLDDGVSVSMYMLADPRDDHGLWVEAYEPAGRVQRWRLRRKRRRQLMQQLRDGADEQPRLRRLRRLLPYFVGFVFWVALIWGGLVPWLRDDSPVSSTTPPLSVQCVVDTVLEQWDGDDGDKFLEKLEVGWVDDSPFLYLDGQLVAEIKSCASVE